MNKLVLLFACLPFFTNAQNKSHVPPSETDYEAMSHYKDSIERHKSPAMQYLPHRCKNRYAKYGWVGKMHQTIIPFEYDQLPEKLRDLNSVSKNGNFGAIDANGREVVPFKYGAVNISLDGKRAFAHSRDANAWSAWNAEGKQVLPEKYQNMSNYIVNGKDSLIRAYDPQIKKFILFDHQGKMVFSIDYEYFYEMIPGKFLASKSTGNGYVNGVVDMKGNVLVPVIFKQISWVSEDYAEVMQQTGERGLFQISTQKFSTFPYLVSKPDHNGNFVISTGQHWDDGKLGLVNAQFKEIFPSKFKSIYPIGESQSYTLSTQTHSGIGDAKGKLLLDTAYQNIMQAYVAADNSLPIKLGTMENIKKLPFYLFGEASPSYPSPNAGLWHEQKGKIADPNSYDYIYPVSDQNFVTVKGETCLLKNIEGKILSKQYKSFNFYQSRFLLGQLYTTKGYEIFNTDGQVLSTIPSVPESLDNGFFIVKGTSGYALLNGSLKQISDYKYTDLKPFAMLDPRYWKEAINTEDTKGYTKWVAFGIENTSIILLDTNGKTLKLSVN